MSTPPARDAPLAALLGSSPIDVQAEPGCAARAGRSAASWNSRVALLVTDPAIRAAGHAAVVIDSLEASGLRVTVFDGVDPNPTTACVDRGLAIARQADPDLVVAVGGGSAMDCAKAVNLLYRCGGAMIDYRGDAPANVLAARPALLPMILVPTTAGTGSEAQSFALISDAATKMKMACGDRRPPANGGLRPRAALLDPSLLRTVPAGVAAATGIDAISHAIETAGCRVRTEASRALSREAWRRLSANFESFLLDPQDPIAGLQMLVGAHLAGCAIEQSMLGAAHACANPLTANFDIPHGVAVGVMLPAVIRFNAGMSDSQGAVNRNECDGQIANPYADLDSSAEALARRVESLLSIAAIPRALSELGVPHEAIAMLAQQAAQQWTAGFNPRGVRVAELTAIYESAYAR